MHELVKKYFADIPKSDVPELKPRIEAEQIGERRIKVRAPAKVPYLMLGYKVPVLRTAQEEWEPYALEVLASVLSASRSSRFDKNLVRDKQVAINADTGYSMHSMNDEMFLIDATPAPGKSIAELEQAIMEEVNRLKTEKVSEEELNRIKAQVIANDVYEKDSVFYQAMALGMLETVGVGWEKADEYLDKVRAVTPEQLQLVAQKYLQNDRLVVAVLEPTDGKTKSARHSGIQLPH